MQTVIKKLNDQKDDLSSERHLNVIAFAATITLSVAISASQGFATEGNLFGVTLNSTADDLVKNAAINQARDGATWLS